MQLARQTDLTATWMQTYARPLACAYAMRFLALPLRGCPSLSGTRAPPRKPLQNLLHAFQLEPNRSACNLKHKNCGKHTLGTHKCSYTNTRWVTPSTSYKRAPVCEHSQLELARRSELLLQLATVGKVESLLVHLLLRPSSPVSSLLVQRLLLLSSLLGFFFHFNSRLMSALPFLNS